LTILIGASYRRHYRERSFRYYAHPSRQTSQGARDTLERDGAAQQISRWRNKKPSAAQSRELDRMDKQNQQLRGVTADVLALASVLRKGTIERVLGMSDLELGLQYLLGKQSSNRR
jgi:hypothetical protein